MKKTTEMGKWRILWGEDFIKQKNRLDDKKTNIIDKKKRGEYTQFSHKYKYTK